MCNYLDCVTINQTESLPTNSREMQFVKGQRPHQHLRPTEQEAKFQNTEVDGPQQTIKKQQEKMCQVGTLSVLPLTDVRNDHSSLPFFDIHNGALAPGRLVEAKNNHKSIINTAYSTEDPFDPGYELWEVVAAGVRVRIKEYDGKSRRVAELDPGTIVRCVAKSYGGRKLKIDLPLIGWCAPKFLRRLPSGSQNRRGQTQELHPFKRVEPSTLPVLNGRFVLELKLGQGSFGKVFVAWDAIEKRKVAIKIDQPKGEKSSVFKREIMIMQVVRACKCVPMLLSHDRVKSHTKSGEDVGKEDSFLHLQYMVLDLQGLSLSTLQKNYLKFFSLKTVLMLGIEIVQMLRSVHDTGILHRDIKPANFVISRGDKGRGIYILDFGLSVMYRREDGSHVRLKKGCRRCGTARYSSVNTHNRIRQSRRDDLEAVGYVLMLFLRSLPWKQKKGEDPEKKWKRILNEKLKWTPKELCIGLSPLVGNVFCKYFEYCRQLMYEEEPDYDYLITLFTKTLQQNNEVIDFMYDWVTML